MRQNRVVSEENKFSKEYFEKEKKRAIEELEKADNFVLLYHSKGQGSGGGISCMDSQCVLQMGYNLDKMSRETMETIKTLIKAGAITMPDFLKGSNE